MFTEDDLETIDALLAEGNTPDAVAEKYGLSYTQLRFRLLQAGKRVETFRRLVSTAPAPKPPVSLNNLATSGRS